MVTLLAKGMTSCFIFVLNSDCKPKAVPVNSSLNVMLRLQQQNLQYVKDLMTRAKASRTAAIPPHSPSAEPQ